MNGMGTGCEEGESDCAVRAGVLIVIACKVERERGICEHVRRKQKTGHQKDTEGRE